MPNQAALRIMTRNSRMPESLAADLDAECSACLMGSRRLAELFARYGRDTVRGLLRPDRRAHHRDLPARDPGQDPGRRVRTWEDYAEHDGVDEPKLHTQRITLTRTGADDARRTKG